MSYHDEQESIESVKAWWARWGNLTTWILTAVLVVVAAWNGWNFWQRHQASEASGLYEAVQPVADPPAGHRQPALHRRFLDRRLGQPARLAARARDPQADRRGTGRPRLHRGRDR
ncbi:tetratricopeptide repeat protein, partial [Burkholderia gladioli]|nr:tetratricopeptide repeat protein [Burkholderia gladioli]